VIESSFSRIKLERRKKNIVYVNGGCVIAIVSIWKSSLTRNFPQQRNSRKTNKRREELGLLYSYQQVETSHNPKTFKNVH
jgi:hypothetical protein